MLAQISEVCQGHQKMGVQGDALFLHFLKGGKGVKSTLWNRNSLLDMR